jgi:secreted PhoX family phosphatase
MRRRDFVAAGAAAAGALAFGPSFWKRAFEAQGATAGTGPYGPLLAPDANGIMLPAGFSSRVIARANVPVEGTTYPWHVFSDGQATYTTDDGGWILVSNSEVPAQFGGGSSAIRFNGDGSIADAYRILGGTSTNCAGGRTPWGTWLSCEEWDGGQVWEADPRGVATAVVRPAMGVFNHESVAVDPERKQLYLTEDKPDGGFYRFTPVAYPDLSAGLLEVAAVNGSAVSWLEVPDPSAITTPTRQQLPAMTKFTGGEGSWYDSGIVYFTTKGDNRVWAYDAAAETIEIIYDLAATPDGPLKGVDNCTVTSAGDLYVCEDGGNLEICLITPERVVAPFLRVTGQEHEGAPGSPATSELAGVIFDPSGTRLYFSSQRGFGLGIIFEVSGPFNVDPSRPGPPKAGPPGGKEEPPGIRIMTRKRVAYRRLLARGGLPVRVKIDKPGVVGISLMTADVDTTPGQRGSSERPKPLTIGRFRRRFKKAGARKVKVKLDRKKARRLRKKRSVVVRVTAQLRDEDGDVVVVTRRIRVDMRKRKRRS